MDNKVKAKLMPLIEEIAVREYFVEKLSVRLSKMWKQKQTNNRMYIHMSWQYHHFLDKIDDLYEDIDKLTPPGTYYGDMPRVKIVD